MNYIEVKKWMLGEGLEIKAVAQAAGVSPTTITLTLQNKRFGSYLKVKKALKRFKCPGEFLKREKKKQKPPSPQPSPLKGEGVKTKRARGQGQ